MSDLLAALPYAGFEQVQNIVSRESRNYLQPCNREQVSKTSKTRLGRHAAILHQ